MSKYLLSCYAKYCFGATSLYLKLITQAAVVTDLLTPVCGRIYSNSPVSFYLKTHHRPATAQKDLTDGEKATGRTIDTDFHFYVVSTTVSREVCRQRFATCMHALCGPLKARAAGCQPAILPPLIKLMCTGHWRGAGL